MMNDVLLKIRLLYVQNEQVIQNLKVNILKMTAYNLIMNEFCDA